MSEKSRLLKECETTHDFLFPGLVCQTGASERPTSLLQTVQMLLDPFDILQPKLGLDDLHISQRVDITLDVDDFIVIESTDDLEDTIDGTDVGQELIAQPRAC